MAFDPMAPPLGRARTPSSQSDATPRKGFDVATVAGLLGGVGLIVAAVVIGGSAGSFVNAPALLIVIGGTLSATVICFSFEDVVASGRLIAKAVTSREPSPKETAVWMVRLAESARRKGTLALQTVQPRIEPNAFLHRGLGSLVDGMPPADLQALLCRDLQSAASRQAIGAQVLRRAAEFAPAMGLIGTLIGLVQMLGRLDDPTTIGPSMAIALLTTLYGAILANLVFAPLAAKLDRKAAADALIGQIQLVGLISIARQENPSHLEIQLDTLLPPAQRLQHFD